MLENIIILHSFHCRLLTRRSSSATASGTSATNTTRASASSWSRRGSTQGSSTRSARSWTTRRPEPFSTTPSPSGTSTTSSWCHSMSARAPCPPRTMSSSTTPSIFPSTRSRYKYKLHIFPSLIYSYSASDLQADPHVLQLAGHGACPRPLPVRPQARLPGRRARPQGAQRPARGEALLPLNRQVLPCGFRKLKKSPVNNKIVRCVYMYVQSHHKIVLLYSSFLYIPMSYMTTIPSEDFGSTNLFYFTLKIYENLNV